jgi:hypothetical protein
MSSLLDARAHFRASFDVSSDSGVDDAWRGALRAIQHWIAEKERDATPKLNLRGSWFFDGGRWKALSPSKSLVQTAVAMASDGGSLPAWSVRYEHADSSAKGRRWRTDIGLDRSGTGVRFSIFVSNWLMPTFVGEEPPQPPPASPRLVSSLLRSLRCHEPGGTESLTAEPVTLAVGQGHLLEQKIFSGSRRVPLVFITRIFPTGSCPVDPVKLARALAGVALVVVAESEVVDKETEQLLPRLYRCWGGRVRIYLPGANTALLGEDRRHRFFEPEAIAAAGPEALAAVLVRSITRWTLANSPSRITTLEDVESLNTRARLLALSRSASTDAATREYLKWFEKENQQLVEKVRHQETVLGGREDALMEAEERYERAEHDCARLREEVKVLSQEVARFRKANDAAMQFETLPRDCADVLARIGQLFPARLVPTDTALKTAGSYQGPAGVDDVWRCVFAVAKDLYDLYDRGEPNIPAAFRAATSFELALTEGAATREQPKMMKLRDIEYKGERVRAEAHVKVGSTFRLHYFWDAADRVLVIGHCGEHLKTAGTRHL